MVASRLICVYAGQDRAHQKRKAVRKGPRSPVLCWTCSNASAGPKRKARHGGYVLAKYGITGEEYAAIKALDPDGKCPGERRATGERKALAVDHSHSLENAGVPIRYTVRGVLCGTCNKILGHFRDDPAGLRRLADYLENPPAWKIIPRPDNWESFF